jgi:hypothetical protein
MRNLFLILLILLLSCKKTEIDKIPSIDSPPIYLKIDASDRNDKLYTSDIILVQ